MKKYQIIYCLSILLLIGIGSSSCTHRLEVQEGAPFEVTHLPYYSEIGLRQSAEIRMNLSTEDTFSGTKYTVRYFPYQGKGYLRIGGDGEALRPNDTYPIKQGNFRMYYTPIVSGSHELELVFENNHNQSFTVTLSFKVPEKGKGQGGDGESSSSNPNMQHSSDDDSLASGVPYLGTDGNWYINGQNTGVKSNIDPTLFDPLLEIKDGYWYINGEKSKLPAKEGDIGTLTIGENGNWYINGEDSWIKAPKMNKPSVGINSNRHYTLDGQDTNVLAPPEDEIVSMDEYIKNNTIDLDLSTLGAGQVEVRLVSKQGTSKVEVEGSDSDVEYTGLVQKDGNAIYRVFRDQKPVPNAIVRNMPKLTGKKYQADNAGYFIVPNKDLAYKGDMTPESVSVSINGKQYQSAPTTIVPNRIRVGMELIYNINHSYYFGFTQKQGDKETGIVELPIEVEDMDYFFREGNYHIQLKGYKTGAFGTRRIHKGVPQSAITVNPQSLKILFIDEFRETPGGSRKVAYYATFYCKGPYGAIVESSIFLGFSKENPLSPTVGLIDILPF